MGNAASMGNCEVSEDAKYTEPLYNPDSLTAWEYGIYELFREARRFEFFDKLDYSTNASKCDRLIFRFNISLPQIDETSEFAESFNNYYVERLNEFRAKEDELWLKSIEALPDGHSMHFPIYEKEVLFAFEWSNFLSVVINESVQTPRALYTPLCDNFDLRTGERLTLGDVFTVEFEIYSERIRDALQKPDFNFPQNLWPWLEDASERIPMPESENFLLTPHGLALIYRHGEIASQSQGVVILFVEYGDICDILTIFT